MTEPDNTTGDNSQEGSGSDNSEGIDFLVKSFRIFLIIKE